MPELARSRALAAPKGECIRIYQAKHEHLSYNYLQNLLPIYQLLYIVMATCDCGSIFCHCYDISSLYFVVVMTFMCIMVVIVVLALLNF